jgi:RNA recognition motif-containing protein
MSWTQVYVTGLSQTTDPSDEALEELFEARYHLSSTDTDMTWAGAGSTLVKRDKNTGQCRGYAFLAFFSAGGAAIAVERINSNHFTYNVEPRNKGNEEEDTDAEADTDALPAVQSKSLLPLNLRAELSKLKSKGKKKPTGNSSEQQGDYSDIRLRRKRTAPARKHPVITSSDKSRTGVGNKTK